MSDASPPPYSPIAPYLTVDDGAAAIDFYKRAFGAEEVDVMKGPDGTVMHAEIRIGDSMIMLGEENLEWGMKSPLSTNGNASSLHIYVPDVDAAFARAIEAGATSPPPPSSP